MGFVRQKMLGRADAVTFRITTRYVGGERTVVKLTEVAGKWTAKKGKKQNRIADI